MGVMIRKLTTRARCLSLKKIAVPESASVISLTLMFTPYLVGERTPHADSLVRGSFVGIDARHGRGHFARAVIEGVTFSLNESIEIMRNSGKTIDTIISIGGGAKSDLWLQIQADIFNTKIVKLKSEQGPGLGAAILAAYGCGWFNTITECVDTFVAHERVIEPIPQNVAMYSKLYKIYREVYGATKTLNESLNSFR